MKSIKRREKEKAYSKEYYKSHKTEHAITMSRWYQIHKNECAIKQKQHRKTNSEKIKIARKKYNDGLKYKIINHYSNGTMKCQCCGEDDYNALTIDHINNDGVEHRKKFKTTIYNWLIDNNFPDGFQILCMNCNCIKEWYGDIEYRKNKYSFEKLRI